MRNWARRSYRATEALARGPGAGSAVVRHWNFSIATDLHTHAIRLDPVVASGGIVIAPRREARIVANPTFVDADTNNPAQQLKHFLPFRIAIVASAILGALTRICARYGLAVTEWRVMATLADGGELTAKEVGLRTRMHKTKVSRAVSLLAAKHLIDSRIDHADHRRTILNLSPKGTQVFRETVPLAAEFGEKLESAILTEDRAAFERCLQVLQNLVTDRAGAAVDLD